MALPGGGSSRGSGRCGFGVQMTFRLLMVGGRGKGREVPRVLREGTT